MNTSTLTTITFGKRCMVILLAFMMIFSALPAGVFAYGSADAVSAEAVPQEPESSEPAPSGAESCDLWIGDTEVTSANCGNIPGVIGEGAKAEYDPDTRTLTLTNVTGISWTEPPAPKSSVITGSGDLTLKLVGENTIVCSDDIYGIRLSSGSLTVEGEGSLKIDSNFIAVFVSNDLNLKGGTLDFSTKRKISDFFKSGLVDGPITIRETLNVDGGVLKAELAPEQAQSGNYPVNAVRTRNINVYSGNIDIKVYAPVSGSRVVTKVLYALRDINVTGGDIKIDSANSEYGIYSPGYNYIQSGGTVYSRAYSGLFASNTVTVSGGELTCVAIGEEEYSYGIISNYGISFLNGTKKVTAISENGEPIRGMRNGRGPITIEDGLTLLIPEGGGIGENSWGDPIIVDKNGDRATTVEIAALVKYDLWVGETQVTSTNCNDIPGVLGDGAKAEYEPETQTLSFTNVTGVTGDHESSAVYAKDIDLTVKGSANIETNKPYGIRVFRSASAAPCSLTLNGDITVKAAFVSVSCDGDITAAGGIITALPNNAQASHRAVISRGKIIITGGIFEARSYSFMYEAIGANSSTADIVIPDTHYIKTPFGGSVNIGSNNDLPYASIADKDGQLANHVVIAPKTYYDITVVTSGSGTVTVPEKALAGQPITLTVEPGEDYELSTVNQAYGMVQNLLYDKTSLYGSLPVRFTMPADNVTLYVDFREIRYGGLASLTVSEGKLEPEFKTKITSYTDVLGCGVDEIEVSFEVTKGRYFLLDRTQFKEGTLKYTYSDPTYLNSPTGATGTVVLTGDQTVLKIKTLPFNGELISIEYTVTFDRTAHTLTHYDQVDPWCETTGTDEYWKCTVCNKLFSDKDAQNEIKAPKTISELGHDFSREKVNDKYLKTGETCTESAVYYKSCTRCGKPSDALTFTYGKPLGHDFSDEKVSDEYLKTETDCEHAAVYYKSCTRCGKASDTLTFSHGKPYGHDYSKEDADEKYLISGATCTEAAVYYKICSRCGETNDKFTFTYGDPLGHDFNKEDTDEKYLKTVATCTEATVYYKCCTRCGEKGEDTFTYGEPNGHTPGEPKIVKYPSVTADGQKCIYCTVCGEELETEAIPKLVNNFRDVPQSSWYAEAAAFCRAFGIVSGTGADTFSPDLRLTRGMFVLMLAKLDGADPDKYTYSGRFTDVKADDWFAGAVEWSVENNIPGGTSETTFSPNDPITREQLAAFFYKYATVKGYNVSARADLGRYTDADNISDWAEDAMRWAVAEGLITGTSVTTLSPGSSVTRAQAVVMFRNFALKYITAFK